MHNTHYQKMCWTILFTLYLVCAVTSQNHNCGISNRNTTVWCDNEDFITLPKTFPQKITKIYIIHSWIRSTKALSTYKNLEEINIISSYIEETNFRELVNLPKLYYLDLEGNSLKTFNFQHLKNTNLKTLILKDNLRITLKGSGGNSLQNLDLEGCGLKEVPMKHIKQFKQLRTLNLANNYIEKLPRDLMETFPKLVDLKLSGNLLKCEEGLKNLADICFNEPETLVSIDDVKNATTNKPYLDVANDYKNGVIRSYQAEIILMILIAVLLYVFFAVLKILAAQHTQFKYDITERTDKITV